MTDNARFNENTILVGHSLGAVVAMKALERKGIKIRKLVLLSGYLTDNPEEKYLDTFNREFDFAKIKSLAQEIVVIHDIKDTNIPVSKGEELAKQLKVIPVIIDAKEEHICAEFEPDILPHIVVENKYDKTSTSAELKSFIADIVGVILQRYETSGSSLDEAVESIRQEFAIDELPIDTSKIRTTKDLAAQLIPIFEKLFDAKFLGTEPRVVDPVLRMIYLSMIDKYRITHIDDMQYLRDKVGLYGYAQQDPLIIYKKEAFEKFEQLIFNIKQETIAIIFRTDFRSGQAQTIVATDQQEAHHMLDRLQEASQDLPEFTPYAKRQPQPMPQNYAEAKQQQYANAFKSDDGVEVIETARPTAAHEKKYGRNDVVTVVSPQGKEEEMKYKKAEGLLSQGWRIK